MPGRCFCSSKFVACSPFRGNSAIKSAFRQELASWDVCSHQTHSGLLRRIYVEWLCCMHQMYPVTSSFRKWCGQTSSKVRPTHEAVLFQIKKNKMTQVWEEVQEPSPMTQCWVNVYEQWLRLGQKLRKMQLLGTSLFSVPALHSCWQGET